MSCLSMADPHFLDDRTTQDHESDAPGAATSDDRLAYEQAIKYAEDLARIFEEEKARRSELEEANRRLAKEIAKHKEARQELYRLNSELEERVLKRTLALAEANHDLQKEIDRRIELEEQLNEAREDLEERVRERTRELASANASLEKEVRRRESIERRREGDLRFLAVLLDAIPNPVFYKDTDGKYLGCNEAFAKFFGKQTEEIVGKTVFDIAPPELAQEYARQDEELFGNPGVQVYTSQVRAKDGQHREVMFHKAVFAGNDGRTAGLIGVILDVTDLVRAKREAEKANKAKSEFLARMSHEIRTPMNGILGMSHVVLNTPLDPDQRECVAAVKESAESLLRIINDILDFSKIEAGELDVVDTGFDPHTLLQRILATVRPLAEEKNLRLNHEVESSVPRKVMGDSGRLSQVLINLLGNAIKFTEEGEVAVKVKLEALAGAEVTLRFTVKDTGIGIPVEKQALVFEAFEQVDGSSKRRFGGTGLGLTISSQLAKLMGGSIELKSEIDRGTRFDLIVPFRVHEPTVSDEARNPRSSIVETGEELAGNASAAIPRAKSANGRSGQHKGLDSLHPLHILLAEDNRVNRKLAVKILENMGHAVTTAEDGAQAIELFETEHFDLILMDVEMPEVDGFQATDAIRRIEEHRDTRVPIVAMTAHALNGYEEKCLQAGMNGYLSKPIHVNRLKQLVDRFRKQDFN